MEAKQTKMDISSKEDIKFIVDTFYDQALNHPSLSVVFLNHMSETLEKHKPNIYSFWESILLGAGSYRGNPMKVHIDLNKKIKLTPELFTDWVSLFERTLLAHFEGPKTQEAISKANMMKDLMLFKIDQSNNQHFIQ